MTVDELMFFDKMPSMLPLYEILSGKLAETFPSMSLRVGKTQITFCSPRVFAMVSLPWRKPKGWPEEYLLVSFGLGYQKQSLRIAQSVEPYPNRWTHHVIIEREDELDRELMDWLTEAYQFSLMK